jgi:hypothetical protein
VSVLKSFAVAGAAALMVLCAAAARAGAGATDDPHFLLFAGTDLWREGAFLDGGLLWSPAGLNADGFTLKLILSGGGYTYPSAGLHTDVDGTTLSAAALPGWRFTRDGIAVGLYAGPIVQDYRLTPDDPGSRLRGLYAGAQSAADVWYQPSAETMVAFNGMIASIGPTESLRVAFGVRLVDPLFVGPEAIGFWCADYQQARIGAHVTGLHMDGLDWSAAGGWGIDSDRRAGPYLRVGVSTRY